MQSFWTNRRVLITGHTGFKGSWLALWLIRAGAKVHGVALAPETSPCLYEALKLKDFTESNYCDIRDYDKLRAIVHRIEPEIVFHLAAQPLVRASYRKPTETFSANLMGTVNLLESLKGLVSVKAAVMVTTDKVYQNTEQAYPYRETDPLGGYDPYSASKACCEIAINCYRDSFLHEQGIALASARAGNVIGGGDWSEDRLIPDAVRAWGKGDSLDIRRPDAVRPWQHVLEPLMGYIKLAEKLVDSNDFASEYNFGPHTHEAATVKTVIDLASKLWPKASDVNYAQSETGPHEAGWLALETAKSRNLLGCVPCWGIEEAITRTMDWYFQFNSGKNALNLCESDITAFELKHRGCSG